MSRSVITCLLVLAGCPDQKVGTFNAAPIVSIQAPVDGATIDEGTGIEFLGQVSDSSTRPEDLQVQWVSDIDGVLTETDPCDSTGTCTFTTASLSAGFNHVITLAATDEQGERSEYDITLTIVEVPDNPEIDLVHPAGGESAVEGEPFEFVVRVSDQQDAPELLAVTMESDLDGVFCEPTPDAANVASCEQVLSPGTHDLTFTVTDLGGFTAEETYLFTVVAGTAIDDDNDGYTEEMGDCDDTDATVGPNEDEFYNGRDDDCDGVIDNDTDGYDDDGDGQSEYAGDCDDDDVTMYDGGTEIYDAKDNDCDGTTDEDTEGYDDDGDGIAEIAGDCDDADPSSEPGAPELEDGADNDCDGTVDEGTDAYDDDGDGYTENGGDCDDATYAFNPAATETCDGYDNDCDLTVDEQNATGCSTYYYDYDGDGYGSSSVSGRCYCAATSYYTSAVATDCYDYNASANPVQTTYQTANRGDSSYDYNCDGTETKAYAGGYSCTATFGDCEPTGTGFTTTTSCGSSGTYLDDDDDCDLEWDWFSTSCEVAGAGSATQSCL